MTNFLVLTHLDRNKEYVRQEEYTFLQENLQTSQEQLEDLKDIITKMKTVIHEKDTEIERISSLKESDMVQQISTLNKLRQIELDKFREQEESFSDVELVKLKEISHLAPKILFCFQVFEEKAFKYLFEGAKHVSIELAEKCLKEKLKIEDIDAFLLARYVIEPREQSTVVLQKDRTAYRREILSRLKSIAFKKITQKDFFALESEIRSVENND